MLPQITGLPAEVVLGFYRDQCERANAIVAATPLPTPPQGRHPGDPAREICDLRRIILHMIEETARHAGHLDIARDLTDNRTGLGQRYPRPRLPDMRSSADGHQHCQYRPERRLWERFPCPLALLSVMLKIDVGEVCLGDRHLVPASGQAATTEVGWLADLVPPERPDGRVH